MGEVQEKVHVVNKFRATPKRGLVFVETVKVYDDRSDARADARRRNEGSKLFRFRVQTTKKG